MKVLMFTEKVDQEDWLSGFAHEWVRHLANHPAIETLYVVCLYEGVSFLPENVHLYSMGKDKGYNRIRKILELEKATLKNIEDVDLVFGHMIPTYTLLASPLILLHSKPIVQWYTHRNVTLPLRAIDALASHMVTASPESFNLPSKKLTVLGHGIDMSQFSPQNWQNRPDDRPTIVAVGRLSPIKNYEVLIDAVSHLIQVDGLQNVQVKIVGGLTPHHGEEYKSSLEARIKQYGLQKNITLLGPIPHQEVSNLYHEADVTINLCPTGGLDKVVIESMSSGVPVIVHNETFLPLLEGYESLLWAEKLDGKVVAEHLSQVLALDKGKNQELGKELRERVKETYALEGLIDRLVGIFEKALYKK